MRVSFLGGDAACSTDPGTEVDQSLGDDLGLVSTLEATPGVVFRETPQFRWGLAVRLGETPQ
jgi:hypothetical protein